MCFGNVNLESLPRMHSLKCFPANDQKKDQTSGVSTLVSAPSRHIKRVPRCSWLRRKSCWTKADLGLGLWHPERCEILLAGFLIRSKLWILAQKISHGCLKRRSWVRKAVKGTIQTFTTGGASSDFEGVNSCRLSEGSCRERTRLIITGPMIWCEGDLSEDFGNTLICLLTVGAVPSFGLLVWSWWVWCSPTPNACSLF